MTKKGITPVIGKFTSLKHHFIKNYIFNFVMPSALPGAAAELKDEWLPVATLLANKMNCVCALVQLDSVAKPWATHEILDMLSVQVLHNTFKADKAILLGKSFGGLLAHEFALQNPTQVISLVLFAPASTNRDSIVRLCQHREPVVPIFLGWSADDGSYTHRSKFTHNCLQKEFTFHSELYGGHAITQEYNEPILEFLSHYSH